jgi:hypothetical protein
MASGTPNSISSPATCQQPITRTTNNDNNNNERHRQQQERRDTRNRHARRL